jgi:hypothetical protein
LFFKDQKICRSWLASEELKCATFILLNRVIVNDLRWQASSYTGLVCDTNRRLHTVNVGAAEGCDLLILLLLRLRIARERNI